MSALPREVIDMLKQRRTLPLARHHDEVTVMFVDLVGFTEFTSTCTPEEMLGLLSELFCAFDAVAVACKVNKVKTIGDGYMCECGYES